MRPSWLLALALVACKVQEDAPARPDTPPPASASAVPTAGHARIDRAPPEGDVASIVRPALARAEGEGRKLVVYVGAAWCEPCQRFHKALENGELDSSLSDLTLLEFDLDRDNERLATAGYVSAYIPLFALPGPDGRASGRQVEGGVKGDGAVAVVSAKVRSLLGR